MAYNGAIPNSGDLISASQQQIKDNFTAIDSSVFGFSVDHVTLTDGTNGGKHKKMTMIQQGVAPATLITQAAIYTKSLTSGALTQPEVYVRQQTNGTEFLLTRGAPVPASGEGSTYGGLQIKCGRTNYTGGGANQAFTYAGFGQSPFPNNTLSVVCSAQNANLVVQSVSGSYTANGFSIVTASNCTFTFIAIGY